MATFERYPRGYQFFTNFVDEETAIVPLSGGRLFYYEAATTDEADTYSDPDGLIPNANPVVLNSSGRLDDPIYLGSTQDYKERLEDAAGNLILPWPQDDIPSPLNAATTRAALGLATSDSPQFTGLNIGHPTDTTITRASAGNIAVEGNLVHRAGGADIPIADGGTGASTAVGARTNLGAILTDAVFPGALVAIVEDQKASGTEGGTFTSGADRTRDLNTLVYNRNTTVSLASNQFTLPAGSWDISWRAPAHRLDGHQTILRDITAGTDLARGSNAFSGSGTAETNTDSAGSFRVTPSGNNVYELRHRCETTRATNGFGQANALGTEVYAQVIIRAG